MLYSSQMALEAFESGERASHIGEIDRYTVPPYIKCFSYTAFPMKDGTPARIHVCRTLEEVDQAFEHLKGEKVLGFDIEHKPFARRTRTLQIDTSASDNITSLTISEPTSPVDTVSEPTSPVNTVSEPTSPVDEVFAEDGRRQVFKGGVFAGLKDSENRYERTMLHAKQQCSVLQFSSPCHILVIHIAAFPTEGDMVNLDQLRSPRLKALLKSPDIIKVGVGLDGDGMQCAHYLNILPAGLLDLTHLDKVIGGRTATAKQLVGLERLCRDYFGCKIYGKQPRKQEGNYLQTSDWSLPVLSEGQIKYAANDAFLGIALYQAMEKVRCAMDPVPDLPACSATAVYQYEDKGKGRNKATYEGPKYKNKATKERVRRAKKKERERLEALEDSEQVSEEEGEGEARGA